MLCTVILNTDSAPGKIKANSAFWVCKQTCYWINYSRKKYHIYTFNIIPLNYILVNTCESTICLSITALRSNISFYFTYL